MMGQFENMFSLLPGSGVFGVGDLHVGASQQVRLVWYPDVVSNNSSTDDIRWLLMIQLLRLEKVTVPGAARDSPCANLPQNIAKNKPRNQKPQPNMMVSGDTCKMSLKQTSKNAIFCHMCHPLDYEKK